VAITEVFILFGRAEEQDQKDRPVFNWKRKSSGRKKKKGALGNQAPRAAGTTGKRVPRKKRALSAEGQKIAPVKKKGKKKVTSKNVTYKRKTPNRQRSGEVGTRVATARFGKGGRLCSSNKKRTISRSAAVKKKSPGGEG